MSDVSLTDIIQETMAASDPQEADTQEVVEGSEDSADSTEATIDDLIAGLDDEDDDISEDVEDEGDEANPEAGEKYQVKVDGEVIEVTLKEALAGYQRQADYTRKAQALAAEKQELEQVVEEFSGTLETLDQLNAAWDDNPVQVVAHFTANTDNPTQTVALLIKELATAGMLDRDFMEMFGITPDVREQWAKESEVDGLRRKVNSTESAQAKRLQEAEYEAEVQKAIAEYDRQIDDILDAEGLDLTVKQRTAFRSRLAAYAHENELTNLKAAYKALKYEETQKKKALAVKTAERAKQKKAASVVGRSGAGASGAAPIEDSSDLQAVIKAAMAEASKGR